MKNNLSDLHNYLFEQLERLNDDSLSDEELNKEIKKSEAVTKVAETIISNGSLSLKAVQVMGEYGRVNPEKVAPFLIGE
ncbi:MAG: hypothetical protein RR012_01305 [Oscillospiraceae bacterium]